MPDFLLRVTQTRIVKASGNTLQDAINDVAENPELYGEQPPSFGEEIVDGSWLNDFSVWDFK